MHTKTAVNTRQTDKTHLVCCILVGADIQKDLRAVCATLLSGKNQRLWSILRVYTSTNCNIAPSHGHAQTRPRVNVHNPYKTTRKSESSAYILVMELKYTGKHHRNTLKTSNLTNTDRGKIASADTHNAFGASIQQQQPRAVHAILPNGQ